MRGLTLAICGVALLAGGALHAAECPGNPNAIGTSRTIVVDPTEHPELGGMQYHESLPLQDHEVVLTFDDGPLPPKSSRVLEILASECVKATYFMVGKMARDYPDMVRRIYAAGHTIGTHSYDHPLSFNKMPLERAEHEIDDGIAWVNWALGGPRTAPFFRIPGLLRAEGVEHYLASKHIQIWSADFPADDWTKISPQKVFDRALSRIEANHKGILLLHDIHERTVQALPYLLRELKRRGYRIVHVVPAAADQPKTATDPRQWIMHARRIWTSAPAFAETESGSQLPVPSPASFGFANPADPHSLVRDEAQPSHRILGRGRVPLPPVPIWPRGVDAAVAVSTSAGRPVLPAPSPQSFGLQPNTVDAPPQHKATLDVVPQITTSVLNIRRLITTGMFDEATGSVLPLMTRGPLAAPTDMPHGAFP